MMIEKIMTTKFICCSWIHSEEATKWNLLLSFLCCDPFSLTKHQYICCCFIFFSSSFSYCTHIYRYLISLLTCAIGFLIHTTCRMACLHFNLQHIMVKTKWKKKEKTKRKKWSKEIKKRKKKRDNNKVVFDDIHCVCV